MSDIFIPRSVQGITLLKQKAPDLYGDLSKKKAASVNDGVVSTQGDATCETTNTGWLISPENALPHFAANIMVALTSLQQAGKLPEHVEEEKPAQATTTIDNPLL